MPDPSSPSARAALSPSIRMTLKELRPYLGQMRPFAWLLGSGVLLNLLALASSVGLIALSGWFLSAAALAGLTAATAASFNFFVPSAGIRFFAVSRTATRYGERVTSHEGTLKLLSRLRKHVYQAIEPLSPAALMRYGSGDLMTRLTADVDALDTLYLRVLTPSLVALFTIVGCGVVIGVFAWPIGLFAALALLVSGVLGPWLAWYRGYRHSSRWHALNGTLRSRLLERLAALPELLLYGRWQSEIEAMVEAQYQRDAAEQRLARQWGRAQLISQTLLGLTMAGTLLMAAWMASQTRLDPTLIALMGLAVLAAFEAIAMLPQAWQNLGRIQRAAQRLNELGTQVPSITYPEADLATPRDARLELEDVAVTFADGTRALDGVTLTLEAGEHFALLGPSGGGKTTLLNTLVRFVEPSRGRLRLGGVALEDLSEPTLRASFAVAPQDVHLFVASYRDNLRIGAPQASDEQIIELLTALGLEGWLQNQPDGLDSYPDEGGSSLSGGQLRRFGIARALLAPAPVVVLDEPTEGLDEPTAAQVLDEIRRRCASRTLLLITHRLSGLERLDRIGILDDGRLLEAGAPQALLARPDSRYAALNRQVVL
ncbi:cysteine/glutathione ABC transporter ATP-binding protein/permease CydC [Halomonas shantousis]